MTRTNLDEARHYIDHAVIEMEELREELVEARQECEKLQGVIDDLESK